MASSSHVYGVCALALASTLFGSACITGATDDRPNPALGTTQVVAAPQFGVQVFSPSLNVPAGTEVQNCYYFKNPSKVDLDITRFQVVFPPGSHHTTLFETDQIYPDHQEDCFKGVAFASPLNPNGFSIVFASARGDMDFSLPAGVGYHLRANRQLMLQVHYVNASDQATSGNPQVFYNMYAARDSSTITSHMGVFQGQNRSLVIPPHSMESFTTNCPLGSDVNIMAATAHFHSRGTEFDINIAPDSMDNVETQPIYTNTSWNDQPFKIFQQTLPVHAGGGYRFTCAYANNTDNTYTFGPHVETDEHCISMLFVYPWDANASQCLDVPVGQ